MLGLKAKKNRKNESKTHFWMCGQSLQDSPRIICKNYTDFHVKKVSSGSRSGTIIPDSDQTWQKSSGSDRIRIYDDNIDNNKEKGCHLERMESENDGRIHISWQIVVRGKLVYSTLLLIGRKNSDIGKVPCT